MKRKLISFLLISIIFVVSAIIASLDGFNQISFISFIFFLIGIIFYLFYYPMASFNVKYRNMCISNNWEKLEPSEFHIWSTKFCGCFFLVLALILLFV